MEAANISPQIKEFSDYPLSETIFLIVNNHIKAYLALFLLMLNWMCLGRFK